MRKLIVIGLAALPLAACNGDDPAQNAAETEQNVTSEVVVTNDTTAIDAATADAANMAPDVPYMPPEMNEAGNEASNASTNRGTTTARRRRSTPSPAPSEPRASDAAEQPANSNTL